YKRDEPGTVVPLLQSASPAPTDILHLLSQSSRGRHGPIQLPRRECAASRCECGAFIPFAEALRGEMDSYRCGIHLSGASDPDIGRALRLRTIHSTGVLLLAVGADCTRGTTRRLGRRVFHIGL